MAENREKLVPKIRFRGFTDAWVQCKLGEIANVFDGVHQTPKYSDSGIKFVSVENIRNLTGTNKFISVEDYNSQFNNKAEIGDIFMTRITAGIIGETAIVEIDEDFAYYVSLALIKLRDEMSSEFINYCINANSFKNELNKRIIHTAFPKKINLNEIGKCRVIYPSAIEQQKIGSFFCTLDKAIALYKRKLEGLKQLKKAYLQQMLPQAGETAPKVRFNGFIVDWQRKSAREIFCTVSDKEHSHLPVLSASQEYGMILRDEIGIDIKFDIANTSTYKRVLPGQFVIHLRSFQGGLAYSSLEGITSPAYTILDFAVKESHMPIFWVNILKSERFIKMLETVTYGIRDGRSISFNDFSALLLSYPTYDEQATIGKFFRLLDGNISELQSKLNRLSLLKTTYLTKMFV